jgi:hypothetical protein
MIQHSILLKTDLPYGPTIPLSGIYSKERESGYDKDTCTAMFTRALFTVARLWKQQRCPTTDKWIKKMWYLYTMELYSATKKNDICKCMELENIILSKVSQAQRAKNCMFFCHMWTSDLTQIQQYYERQVTLRGSHIQDREGKRRKLR